MNLRITPRRLVLLTVTLLLAAQTARLAWEPADAPPLPVLDTMGGDFRLDSTRGGTISLDDLAGRLVLLNFGYTGCADVCPTVLARLRTVLIDLEAVNVDVEPLFVTLDPAGDDLETLRSYVAHFHPRLVGLRGTDEQTQTAADRYRVHRQGQPGAEDFVHSVQIYLIDRRGRVRATFGAGVPIADMVATVRRLAASDPPA